MKRSTYTKLEKCEHNWRRLSQERKLELMIGKNTLAYEIYFQNSTLWEVIRRKNKKRKDCSSIHLLNIQDF